MTHDHDPAHEDEHDHEHEHGPLAELVTVRDWLRYAVTRFNRAGCFYGHGLQDAYDEAVYLILHTLALPLDRLEPFLDACIPGDEREDILEVIEKRAVDRLPAAYITGEAWLGEFRFQVDKRVIIPRSYFAELLHDGFTPWVQDPDAVTAAMDMCTGSGCLAILMAFAFPNAEIVAVDISQDALDVAAANIAAYGLEDRIRLVKSDGFAQVPEQRFDFILSNPPYVTREAMDALPAEYLHEPGLALGSGEDGLDLVRKLLADAPRYLAPEGLLAIEVGHNREIVEEAFPALSPTWLSAPSGDDKIFVLEAGQLL
ncbi:50S ribosomal protein L3 glutamine methyltransferase [Zoogloea ramigera]|uniref:50S ribosomal protein L3 glutamine methyltransferase n=1 Tax=Zoogloea ramigera TaxID=350 RepID=A0A4Y4CSI2_ZOORA|nr:50S ribosomal protein L3 N(5)-glutamine methyltransferase [Zoogloea ramigera]MBP7627738.1 50S ribosomal protein L3 N(5)-glutamine methyltransferase [Zoogloea sp.]GEC94203.1 50S ribosomal protein L3 glutamine methyltransferase [Zoogloea ramigera]